MKQHLRRRRSLEAVDCWRNKYMDLMGHEFFMSAALEEAAKAACEGEVPIGAVAGCGGEIVAREHNRTIQLNDPTAHAEILLLKKAASRIGNYRLPDISVYVTVEPCPMCAGALIQARISNLVFGAPDQKGGGVISKFSILEPGKLNHDVPFEYGILEDECRDIMREFFSLRR